jgi:hypothetical protein
MSWPVEQLWVCEPRNIITEPSASVHIPFGGDEAATLADLMASGYLTPGSGGTDNEGNPLGSADTMFYDPVSGILMGAWNTDIPDMVAPDDEGRGFWEYGTGEWAKDPDRPAPFPRSDGKYTQAYSYRDTEEDGSEWMIKSQTTVTGGCPLWLAWITYAPQENQEIDNGDFIWLTFGGKWKVGFETNGDLSLWVITGFDSAGNPEGWCPVAVGKWMASEQYAPSVHRMLIYECGPKLVIRNAAPGLDGKAVGLSYVDPAPYFLSSGQNSNFLNSPYLQDVLYHAIGPGKWWLRGRGDITFALSPAYFRDNTVTSLELATPMSVGWSGEGKTTAAHVTLSGLRQTPYGSIPENGHSPTPAHASAVGPNVVTSAYDDPGGSPRDWPIYPNAGLNDPAQYFKWKISWTNSAFGTVMLTGIDINLPGVIGSDGRIGTDLYQLDGCKVKRFGFSRDPDLSRESAELEVQSIPYSVDTSSDEDDQSDSTKTLDIPDLSFLSVANTPIRYVDDESNTLFRGVTIGAEWSTKVDFTNLLSIGSMRVQCAGLWQRFKDAKNPGINPGDGRKLTDVLKDIMAAAGLTESDYSIPDSTITLPLQPEGSPPAIVWKPGCSLDSILDDLRKKWFGTQFTMFFDARDGKFVVNAVSLTQEAAAAFYSTSADAMAAGDEGRNILSYEMKVDMSQFANDVTVIGEDVNHQLLVARSTDVPSIKGAIPMPWNYYGAPKSMVVCDPGLTTQASVNWVCTQLYLRARWPIRNVVFKSCRVSSLVPGNIVTISGNPYDDANGNPQPIYLRGISVERSIEGLGMRPLALATYSGEIMVDGVVRGPVGS